MDTTTTEATAGHRDIEAHEHFSGGEEKRAETQAARSKLLAGTTLASTGLHALVLAALFAVPVHHLPGGGGERLDSVSIEIVKADALESLSSDRKDAAGGWTAPPEIASATANTASIASPLPSAHEPKEVVRDEPASGLMEEALVHDAAAEIPTAKIAEEQPKIVDEIRKPDQVEAREPAAEPAEAQVQIATTASSIRAQAESPEAGGAAGASAGEVAQYAIEVRKAIGRARPAHAGARGKAMIRFALSKAGALNFATVAISSGSDQLDRSAVRAVEETLFPAPPQDMTESQRIYVVEFEFK